MRLLFSSLMVGAMLAPIIFSGWQMWPVTIFGYFFAGLLICLVCDHWSWRLLVGWLLALWNERVREWATYDGGETNP